LIVFSFQQLLSHLVQTNNISYIVVDETHCEDQWIYPQKNYDYQPLGMLREKYKEIPWIVATATAGLDVDNKILIIIGVTCSIFLNSILYCILNRLLIY